MHGGYHDGDNYHDGGNGSFHSGGARVSRSPRKLYDDFLKNPFLDIDFTDYKYLIQQIMRGNTDHPGSTMPKYLNIPIYMHTLFGDLFTELDDYTENSTTVFKDNRDSASFIYGNLPDIFYNILRHVYNNHDIYLSFTNYKYQIVKSAEALAAIQNELIAANNDVNAANALPAGPAANLAIAAAQARLAAINNVNAIAGNDAQFRDHVNTLMLNYLFGDGGVAPAIPFPPNVNPFLALPPNTPNLTNLYDAIPNIEKEISIIYELLNIETLTYDGIKKGINSVFRNRTFHNYMYDNEMYDYLVGIIFHLIGCVLFFRQRAVIEDMIKYSNSHPENKIDALTRYMLAILMRKSYESFISPYSMKEIKNLTMIRLIKNSFSGLDYQEFKSDVRLTILHSEDIIPNQGIFRQLPFGGEYDTSNVGLTNGLQNMDAALIPMLIRTSTNSLLTPADPNLHAPRGISANVSNHLMQQPPAAGVAYFANSAYGFAEENFDYLDIRPGDEHLSSLIRLGSINRFWLIYNLELDLIYDDDVPLDIYTNTSIPFDNTQPVYFDNIMNDPELPYFDIQVAVATAINRGLFNTVAEYHSVIDENPNIGLINPEKVLLDLRTAQLYEATLSKFLNRFRRMTLYSKLVFDIIPQQLLRTLDYVTGDKIIAGRWIMMFPRGYVVTQPQGTPIANIINAVNGAGVNLAALLNLATQAGFVVPGNPNLNPFTVGALQPTPINITNIVIAYDNIKINAYNILIGFKNYDFRIKFLENIFVNLQVANINNAKIKIDTDVNSLVIFLNSIKRHLENNNALFNIPNDILTTLINDLNKPNMHYSDNFPTLDKRSSDNTFNNILWYFENDKFKKLGLQDGIKEYLQKIGYIRFNTVLNRYIFWFVLIQRLIFSHLRQQIETHEDVNRNLRGMEILDAKLFEEEM